MRSLVATLVFLILVAEVAFAEPSYSLEIKSIYNGSVSGGTFYDGPVAQACITNPVGKHNYFGIWASTNLNGENNFGNEVDYFVGQCRTIDKLGVDYGANYYEMMPLWSKKGDAVAAYTNLTYPIGKWQVKFHAEHDFVTENSCVPGTMYSLAACRKVGTLNLTLMAGGHLEGYGLQAEAMSYGAVEVSIPQSKNMSWSVRVVKPTRPNGMADDAVIVGLTYSK